LPNLDLTPLLLFRIYGVGLFFDCVTFSYFAIPFALLATVLPDRVFNSKRFRPFAWLACFIVTYLMLFNAVAEYTFFDEFATRFNFIAVDYLIYTNEVLQNIRESYPVNWILGALFILNIFIFLFVKKYLDRSFSTVTTFGQRLPPGMFLLVLPVLSFAFVNLSLAHISANNYADELAGNGIYNLFSAYRNNELDYTKFYATKDNKLVLARLKELLTKGNNHLTSLDSNNITRSIRHAAPEKHLNVIVIVEESLSAEYLGVFGNKQGMTPNLDKLAGESLFFTHLYATGTRTVRGLEAITLGMPPLPGSSIVRRPDNGGFFSWGSVMKDKGYENKFIYAGHGYFDNMNAFYANNGFATVDRNNFTKDEVTFSNAWGVCDEDLFNKVVSEANKSYARQKPFFSMVMTTSNHRPFTYPAGKIDIPSQNGRDGGVKYADYAIGRLVAEAKKQPWFRDTVFVIVADHCAGSARTMALPVKHYEIPLLIYSPAHVHAKITDRMLSQIDIAPTVLGLLNFDYDSRFVGEDALNTPAGPKRAFISTYQKMGFIKEDQLLVLGPKKETGFYRFSRQDGKTVETKQQDDLLLDGLAYYQGINYIYKNRLNRVGN
jgi:phosphoglycerol transferase MdoB-like AlkP superfamily enzyme